MSKSTEAATKARRDQLTREIATRVMRRDMSPETRAALALAAEEIERELICCPGERAEDADPRHHICRWGLAARRIVLDVADGTRA